MKARVQKLAIPLGKRVICVSDIHGCLELFQKLLVKVGFRDDDILLLLGDMFTKGPKPQETLQFVRKLAEKPNVYPLRGNCDDGDLDWLTMEDIAWLDSLPHVIDAGAYVFVHAGLENERLDEHDAWTCMKNDAFAEQGKRFTRWVVTGHWPTVNYTRGIACFNPIVDEESKIISIDGGTVLKTAGQMNAFIIQDGTFSFVSVDSFPTEVVNVAQEASANPLNITWLDRHVEPLDGMDGVFGRYKHIATGREIEILNKAVCRDREGRYSECDIGTDYFLPVEAGDVVSIIGRYDGRLLAKKHGILGWIRE